jgi:hypothetical protein
MLVSRRAEAMVPNRRWGAASWIGLLAIPTLAAFHAACSTPSSKCANGQIERNGVCPSATAADSGGPPPASRKLQFDGVASVAPASTTSLQITWVPGFDPQTPRDQLRYRVYLSVGGAPLAFDKPPAATSSPGAAVLLLSTLLPNQHYTVAVRLVAGDGIEDGNQARMSADTVADVTPPRFEGVLRDVNAGGGSIHLAWSAASDDLTPAAGISYLVYMSDTPGAEDYSKPVLTTLPGARSTDVATPGAANYSFVVRARDAAGNLDANTKELSNGTGASFANDVQPLFSYNCAVPGCHVPGEPTANMVLVAGYAYDTIVGVPSSEYPVLDRIHPGSPDQSFLYLKIMGTAPRGTIMPAPGTGNVLTDAQKSIIRTWIEQGALNN